MSVPRPEVRLLQQQVKSLRQGGGGGGGARNNAERREEGGAYKIAMLGPLQAGKTKITAQVRRTRRHRIDKEQATDANLCIEHLHVNRMRLNLKNVCVCG